LTLPICLFNYILIIPIFQTSKREAADMEEVGCSALELLQNLHHVIKYYIRGLYKICLSFAETDLCFLSFHLRRTNLNQVNSSQII